MGRVVFQLGQGTTAWQVLIKKTPFTKKNCQTGWLTQAYAEEQDIGRWQKRTKGCLPRPPLV